MSIASTFPLWNSMLLMTKSQTPSAKAINDYLLSTGSQ